MFSENFILLIQVCASLLMGYDYFVKDNIKSSIDSKADNIAKTTKENSLNRLKQQFSNLRKQTGLFFAILIFILGAYLTRVLLMEYSITNQHIYLFIAFSLVWLFFVFGIVYGIFNKLLAEHLAPMIKPLGTFTLFSVLVYSPKGVIAGAGMLFLLTSFLCRWMNYNL